MYKNIFVPVDGSATSGHGLKNAIGLAKEQHAMLTVLHVVDESWMYRGMGMGVGVDGAGYYIDEIQKEMVKAGKAVLAKSLAAAQKQGVKARAVLVEDVLQPVADIIVKQAKKARADLIVLGTHGRRGITRLVMGSDAEGVLRQASVPVMMVRAPGAGKPRKAPARKPRASVAR